MARLAMVRIVLAAFMMLSIARGGAWAQGPNMLSGVVYGGGTPLAGVNVKLINAASGTQVGSTMTSSIGSYAFTVSNGTYNLQFIPPGSSGFDSAVSNGVVISGANVVQNIVLVSKSIALSGLVRATDGTPLQGVTVTAYPASGGTTALASDVTDASGAYALALPVGSCTCNLSGDETCGLAGAPEEWGVDGAIRNLALTADTTRNITVPFSRLSGKVLGGGVGLGGVTMSFDGRTTMTSGAIGWVKHTVISSNAPVGNYSLALLPLTYDVVLIPPAGTIYARTDYHDEVLSPVPTLYNWTLAPAFQLSGFIRTASGTPLKNVWIKAYPLVGGNGEPADAGATNTGGAYALDLAPNNFYCNLNCSTDCGIPNPPAQWGVGSIIPSITITGDTTRDLTVPFVNLSATVSSQGGVGVGGVTISFDGKGTLPAGGNSWAKHTVVSSTVTPVGAFSVSLPPGTYDVTLDPPSGSPYARTVLKAVLIQSDGSGGGWGGSLLLKLNPANQVSGVVRAADGTPLKSVWVRAYATGSNPSTGEAVLTDASGAYSISLPAGNYDVNVSGVATCGVEGAPTQWVVGKILNNMPLSGDVVQNLIVPFVQLSGMVTDSRGTGVGGVSIAVAGGGPMLQRSGDGWVRHTVVSSTTPPVGSYSMMILPLAYDETLTPAQDSGFAITTLNGIAIRRDTLQNIILTRMGSLDVVPSSLNFLQADGGAVDVEHGGAPKTRTITLTNIGGNAINFTGGASGTPGLELTGRCAADYAIQSVTPAMNNPLAPGASVNIVVRFAPKETSFTLGLDAALIVTCDNPIVPRLTIPLLGDAVPVEMSGFRVE